MFSCGAELFERVKAANVAHLLDDGAFLGRCGLGDVALALQAQPAIDHGPVA